MTQITATKARKEFFNIIKNATEKHQIYHIRHHKGDAVLLSEEEYDSLIETLTLLSSPHFKEKLHQAQLEIDEGKTATFEEVFGEPL